jgi:ATP-dependent RNA helicase RhlE
MKFSELNVIPSILRALEKENYAIPTPIQEKAIPCILSGRDLLGCAQTGTGKTAAFAIPTLQLLCKEKVSHTATREIRALIVTPTRELALQIYDSFCTYGKYTDLKYGVIFGGVSQKPQEEVLKQGVDILVTTPGRLIDLMGQQLIDLKSIRIFILDEADRMLDMGFIHDVNKIIAKTPVNKQTLLFSATMPPDIAKLSDSILKDPAKIAVTPVASTVDTIEQYVYYVDKTNKKDLLVHILKDKSIVSALVFTRTKHGADRIVRLLSKDNVPAQAIHGDKSQGARQSALSNFKNKKLRILIATDIAARGIDIDELSHVINYDLPNIPETYVHRIGRTGRAGLGGIAISFCDFDEKEQLADIENLIGKRITEVKDHPYPLVNDFPSIKTIQPRRGASRENLSQPGKAQQTASKTTVSPKRESSHIVSKSAGSKPTESKPTESKPAGSKPAGSKPAGNKLTRFKPTGSKPTGSIPTGFKPTESKSTESKSVETSPNKKYRMTADGTLKEKRNFFSSSRRPGNRKQNKGKS